MRGSTTQRSAAAPGHVPGVAVPTLNEKGKNMKPDRKYRYDHCKGELGRGHVSRCPKSWLISARAHARVVGDSGMVRACDIALLIHRQFGPSTKVQVDEMRVFAGRRAVAARVHGATRPCGCDKCRTRRMKRVSK